MEKIEDYFNFLDTVSDEYKDIIIDSNAPAVTIRKMVNEIYDYMYKNRKYFNLISQNQINLIMDYARKLSFKFKDPDLGRSFWNSGVGFSFDSLPMDR